MHLKRLPKIWLQSWLQSLPKHIRLRFWTQTTPLLPKEQTQHLNDPLDPLHPFPVRSEPTSFQVGHALEY